MNGDFITTEEGLKLGETLVAPFYPIVQEIRNVVSVENPQTEVREYQISVVVRGKELEPHTFKTLKSLPFFETWSECVDAMLSIREKRALNQYMQMQCLTAKKVTLRYFSKLGYRKPYFVFGRNRVICSNSVGETERYQMDEGIPNFECEEYDRAQLIDYVIQMNKLLPGISEILVLLELVALLKPLFNEAGVPVKFFPVLYGHSGVGKTSLAQLFFLQNEEQKTNFKTTRRKQLGDKISQFSGHTILIDDYHPEASSYGREKQLEKLDIVARKADDSESALIIATAEYLDGISSIQDRMLQIEINKRINDWQKFHELEESKTCYIAFLYEFAKFAYGKAPCIVNRIKEYVQQKKDNNGYRIAYHITLVNVCASLFFREYLTLPEQKDLADAINTEDYCRYIENLLQKLANQQTEHLRRITVLDRGVDWGEWLYTAIRTHKFIEVLDKNTFGKMDRGYPTIYYEKNRYYISRAMLSEAANQYFNKKVPVNDIVSFLSKNNLLLEDRSESHAKKKFGEYYYVVSEDKLKVYFQEKQMHS